MDMEWWIKLILILGISGIFYLIGGSGSISLLLFILLIYLEFFNKNKK